MDSDVRREGRLIDIVDTTCKWREDKLPDEDITVPVMELPDPEPEMCGISAIFHAATNGNTECQCSSELSETQVGLLQRRGPDSIGSSMFIIKERAVEIKFFSTVLHQRGGDVSPQPLRNSLGNVLLWNGEVFDGLDLSDDRNDGEELLHLFSLKNDPENLFATLGKIEGPWAFIYWECSTNRLWFGRDRLGRRSLLWSNSNTESCCSVKICSVASSEETTWEEVPADGIFCLDLKESKTTKQKFYSWSSASVSEREPKAADCLFSELLNRDIPVTENVGDLYGIELPHRDENSDTMKLLTCLGSSLVLQPAVEAFVMKMEEAVRKRTLNQPQMCKDCVRMLLKCNKLQHCTHSSLAVLFSGGVDSIFLAALADRCVPKEKSIDLLNVSFQHRVKRGGGKKARQREDVTFDSPDRLTGQEGLKELTAISPLRSWNFVEINVTTESLQKERLNHIQHLISPGNTVLDDSIGCAMWFAARGEGILTNGDGCRVQYCSPARVVLVGMGADEQLAGYSRHREKFRASGWNAVIEEVSMEMERISCRNLGRDDRIISDHGRESRLPFLDESVVRYLKRLPMWLKANLSLPRGVGEKLLLRLAAISLGLTNSAILPKRAVQFGSRIAHSENRREKGSDVCSRLGKNTQ